MSRNILLLGFLLVLLVILLQPEDSDGWRVRIRTRRLRRAIRRVRVRVRTRRFFRRVGRSIRRVTRKVGRAVRKIRVRIRTRKFFRKIGRVVRRVGRAIRKVTRRMGRFVKRTFRKVKRITKKLTRKIKRFVRKIKKIGKKVFKKIGKFMKKVAKFVAKLCKYSALAAATGAGSLVTIGCTVVKVVQGIRCVVKNRKNIGGMVNNCLQYIPGKFGEVIGKIAKVGQGLQCISRNRKHVGRLVQNCSQFIPGKFGEKFNKIVGKVVQGYKGIQCVRTFRRRPGDLIRNCRKYIPGKLGETINNKIDAVMEKYNEAKGRLQRMKDIVTCIRSGGLGCTDDQDRNEDEVNQDDGNNFIDESSNNQDGDSNVEAVKDEYGTVGDDDGYYSAEDKAEDDYAFAQMDFQNSKEDYLALAKDIAKRQLSQNNLVSLKSQMKSIYRGIYDDSYNNLRSLQRDFVETSLADVKTKLDKDIKRTGIALRR